MAPATVQGTRVVDLSTEQDTAPKTNNRWDPWRIPAVFPEVKVPDDRVEVSATVAIVDQWLVQNNESHFVMGRCTGVKAGHPILR
jgi:hypothetical protein